jgi:hypothetical protein
MYGAKSSLSAAAFGSNNWENVPQHEPKGGTKAENDARVPYSLKACEDFVSKDPLGEAQVTEVATCDSRKTRRTS